jgi:hypothetical protein
VVWRKLDLTAVVHVLNDLSQSHNVVVTKFEYFFGVSIRTVVTVYKIFGLRDPSLGRERIRVPLFLNTSRLHRPRQLLGCSWAIQHAFRTEDDWEHARCFQNDFASTNVLWSSRESSWYLTTNLEAVHITRVRRNRRVTVRHSDTRI